MQFTNKTVLITGGSSGIGKAAALAFAREGARVCISYRENKNGADEVVSEINKIDAKAYAVQADLTRDQDAKQLIEACIEKHHQIDILVNNAGRYIDGDEWNGAEDVWKESIDQNLISAMRVSKYVLEHMKKKQSGTMVNIASRHGLSGQQDAITYASSKAGIISITQAYAKLMAPWGRANSIAPGAVRSGYWKIAPQKELDENIEQTKLKKIVEPEDIANAVVFLASDNARMITGQNLLVDAGYLLK